MAAVVEVVVPPLAEGLVVVVDLAIVVVVVEDVVVVEEVVVVVGTGCIAGMGGFLQIFNAFGVEGWVSPGSPEPNFLRTFSVIVTTGAMGHLPMKGGHDGPSAATHRLVPVANTPAPCPVV